MFKKQKPILPSLKEKRRYLVYEVKSEDKLSFNTVKDSIIRESESYLGKLTMAKAGVIFLNDWINQKGVIKVNNKYEDHIKAVFTQINKIQEQNVLVKSVGVSGILNKARKKYFGG